MDADRCDDGAVQGDPAARVTTVVISRNRRSELLQSLRRHTGPVVLVDNASVDGTVEAVSRELPEVSLIALSTNEGAVARNRGARAARTPYVAFADDDSWWAPGSLERAADILDAHDRVALIAARVLVGSRQEPDPFCEVLIRSPLPAREGLPGTPVLGFMACAAIVRRDAFLAVGGFDDVVEFVGEEERVALDLAEQGWDLLHVPELVVHHHPSPVRSGRGARTRRVVRNSVLTALMRRSWPVVLARTARHATRDVDGALGVAAVLPRVTRAVAVRGPVGRPVEEVARLLE